MKNPPMKLEQIISAMGKRARKFSIYLYQGGRDVLIVSKHRPVDGNHRLRARFWLGETKHFSDQTPDLLKWTANGAKGICFPDNTKRTY